MFRRPHGTEDFFCFVTGDAASNRRACTFPDSQIGYFVFIVAVEGSISSLFQRNLLVMLTILGLVFFLSKVEQSNKCKKYMLFLHIG